MKTPSVEGKVKSTHEQKNNELVPHVSVGPVTLNGSIFEVARSLELQFEGDGISNVFFDVGRGLEIETEDNFVDAVKCTKSLTYGGINLIGATAQSVIDLLGLPDQRDEVDSSFVMFDYCSLGLLISFENGIVSIVDVFAPDVKFPRSLILVPYREFDGVAFGASFSTRRGRYISAGEGVYRLPRSDTLFHVFDDRLSFVETSDSCVLNGVEIIGTPIESDEAVLHLNSGYFAFSTKRKIHRIYAAENESKLVELYSKICGTTAQ